MAKRDEEYVEELEETEQERGVRKSKVHSHCTVIRNAADNGAKLKCNYCNKAYAYTGGNTSSMMQHF